MNVLIKKIKRAFSLTKDLIESLEQDSLGLKLDNLPSNKIGEQIWCITGARESYLNALRAGKWSGFSCTLQNITSKSEVLKCLDSSSSDFLKFLNEINFSEFQNGLILDLLEHEVMHHGQLIRYIYGNKLEFPKSWNERYTV